MTAIALRTSFRLARQYGAQLAGFLLLTLSCGCATHGTYDTEMDIWPLFRYSTELQSGSRRLEALGPFLEWQSAKDTSRFSLRPVYSRWTEKGESLTQSEWLYPFGFGTRRPNIVRQVFWPLCVFDRETLSDGSVKRRDIILPLWFYRSHKESRDVLLFPLGGVLRDFMGREKIVVCLWPILVYQRGKEAQSWSVLHPFFSRIKWADGGGGIKAWPLFGINRRPEQMTNMFILWPIVNYQFTHSDRGNIKRLLIFPLYGRLDEPSGYERAVIWPFFSHRVDRARGENEWWYPWPFFGHRAGKKTRGWSVWPIYAINRSENKTNSQVLWPFGWYSYKQNQSQQASSFRLIPFMFYQREQFMPVAQSGKTSKVTTGAWQIWPLFKYRHERDGSAAEFLSLLPLRWHASWERNFAPIFRIFEYRHAEKTGRSWQAFWGIFRLDSSRTDCFVELAPVLKVHLQKGDRRGFHWSLLRGLVGHERTPDGSRWRLLYLLSF